MHKNIRSEVDRIKIMEAAYSLIGPDGWHKDSTGILMFNRQSVFDPELARLVQPATDELLKACPLHKIEYLMVNVVPPGISAPPHTDTLRNPRVTRYHLPLQTNPHAWFWDEVSGFQTMIAGWWQVLSYKERHAVGNFGHADRVHLIVDLTPIPPIPLKG